MRKMKVLDWIQRSRIEAWENENTTAATMMTAIRGEQIESRRLALDPSANLPSRPYQKHVPIYATAQDPDSLEPELAVPGPASHGGFTTTTTTRAAAAVGGGPAPNQRYPSMDWGSGRSTSVSGGGYPDQRYRMEAPPLPSQSRRRVESVDSGMQFRHPHPQRHGGMQRMMGQQHHHQHHQQQQRGGGIRSGGYPHPHHLPLQQRPHPQQPHLPPLPSSSSSSSAAAANQQNNVTGTPGGYPTAKFSKNYYVLDV